MYRGRANTVIYFFLVISLIIIGVLVYKQVQYSYLLKESVSAGNTSYFSIKGLRQIMTLNQLSLRSFFFTFICFLLVLVSLLMILQSTEKAYRLTNEPNVRYTVKMTYPGIVLAVIGCFFLALSIYRTSDLQLDSSSRMVDQTRYQVILDSLFERKSALEQGISALEVPGNKGATTANGSKDKVAAVSNDKNVTKDKGHGRSKGSAAHPARLAAVHNAHSKDKKHGARNEMAAGKTASKHDTVAVNDHGKAAGHKLLAKNKSVPRPAAAPAKATPAEKIAPAEAAAEKNTVSEPLTSAEIQYASQLQRQATIYGHFPTAKEITDYNRIYKKLERQKWAAASEDKEVGDGATRLGFRSDMHWAFDLLLRTKNGYQPTPEELVRYEHTIERNLQASNNSNWR